GASGPDEGIDLGQWYGSRNFGKSRADIRSRASDLRVRGRVGGEVAFGDPHATDIDRHGSPGCIPAAEDKLSRPAAEVDNKNVSGAVRNDARGNDEGEPGFFLPADHLGGHAEEAVDAGDELSPVGGVAGSGGRAEPDAARPFRSDEVGVLLRRLEGSGKSIGVEPLCAVNVLAQADDAQCSAHVAHVHATCVGGKVGDEQADRVRSAIDSCYFHPCTFRSRRARLVRAGRRSGRDVEALSFSTCTRAGPTGAWGAPRLRRRAGWFLGRARRNGRGALGG